MSAPSLQTEALHTFDTRAQLCLELLGLSLTPRAWQQATLEVGMGGLGLRSAARHASAAYIASVSSGMDSCQVLDANYQADIAEPVAQFNARAVSSAALPPSQPPGRSGRGTAWVLHWNGHGAPFKVSLLPGADKHRILLDHLYQALGVALQRENARAVLRQLRATEAAPILLNPECHTCRWRLQTACVPFLGNAHT